LPPAPPHPERGFAAKNTKNAKGRVLVLALLAFLAAKILFVFIARSP
jgi:hypothetical protein